MRMDASEIMEINSGPLIPSDGGSWGNYDPGIVMEDPGLHPIIYPGLQPVEAGIPSMYRDDPEIIPIPLDWMDEPALGPATFRIGEPEKYPERILEINNGPYPSEIVSANLVSLPSAPGTVSVAGSVTVPSVSAMASQPIPEWVKLAGLALIVYFLVKK